MRWKIKLLCAALLVGLSASMAAQSSSNGHASPATQPRFAQSTTSQTQAIEPARYVGSPIQASCIAGTNFYFLGTVSSSDSVEQHFSEVVTPAERVQERPGDRIQPMPRIGED